jgi:hypothetical protein
MWVGQAGFSKVRKPMAVLTTDKRQSKTDAVLPPRAKHAVAEVERRLRSPTEHNRACYGLKELTNASECGNIEVLLLTAVAALRQDHHVIVASVTAHGGTVFVVQDAASNAGALLNRLGGAAALLRWAPADGGFDNDDDNNKDSRVEAVADALPTLGSKENDAPKSCRSNHGGDVNVSSLCRPPVLSDAEGLCCTNISAAASAAAILVKTDGDNNDSDSSHQLSEEVAEEFESLEAIYPPGVQDASVEFCRVGYSSECVVAVRSQATNGAGLCLHLCLPPSYPHAHPARVTVCDSVGLSLDAQARVVDACIAAATEELGAPSIFTVATAAHECLLQESAAASAA